MPDLPPRRCRGGGEDEDGGPTYLHDLLGPLTAMYALVVVSGSPEAEDGGTGSGGVAKAVSSCAAVAARLDHVSDTILVVRAACDESAPDGHSPSLTDGKVRTIDLVPVTDTTTTPVAIGCFGFRKGAMRSQDDPNTLAGCLRLRPGAVAILAVRPDMYLALIHRGGACCGAVELEAGLAMGELR
uniref:Uncharacterized protein n=1 Tax=Trieres chinensis TaxID=1514140 RepID=A0A7S1Z6U7_TRICV